MAYYRDDHVTVDPCGLPFARYIRFISSHFPRKAMTRESVALHLFCFLLEISDWIRTMAVSVTDPGPISFSRQWARYAGFQLSQVI